MKRKKDESEEDRKIREAKEKIVSSASRNERLSWDRKLKKMEKLIDELRPIEERILDIISKEKYPIMDKIEALRKVMSSECVHPADYLVIGPDYTHATCKFCQKRIRWQ